MSEPNLLAKIDQCAQEKTSEFAEALLAGLGVRPKCLSSKYFYDMEGSRLFDRICELPEYYPTRTEISLLHDHAAEIAQQMGPDVTLIEFGAGSLRKVGILLDALERPAAYVPLDISGEYLRGVAGKLGQIFRGLAIYPVVADFTRPFVLPPVVANARRVGFFPGSTIGNFDRAEALAFLRKATSILAGGGLLVGVDLVKNPAVLHAAYNDSAGVTAAFNKNVLARANRELDANIDLDAFAHYAFYEMRTQRIEMHLMSLRRQRLSIAGQIVCFDEGEALRTEISHKYTVEGFRTLAAEAGFVPRAVWCDRDRLFSLHWLEAAK
jgi:L-histidine Nalpha-methyltransferase